MTGIHNLIEGWIEMRSKLQQQLKLLESGEMGAGGKILGSTTEETAGRLKQIINELNDLLKEYAHADRT